jgi:hypothetical protein
MPSNAGSTFIAMLTKREFYGMKQGPYTLYYSVDPAIGKPSLVIEEFLSDAEGELIMDTFAEGHD